MKKAKRWRYFCDHCGKSGGSAYHMTKHETGCTKNPDRVCGLCAANSQEQVPLSELVPILAGVFVPDEYGVIHAEGIAGPLERLRDATNNCPACILAAIRQSENGNVPASGFDVAKEFKLFWADVNEALYENQSIY